jgi:membrane fusion protein, copper/silver efflux system
MKKIIFTAIICLIAGLSAGWYLFRDTGKPVMEKTDRTILYYRNPMDPRMTSPTPMKASDGMDYVAVYAEEASSTESQTHIAYYTCSMHPFIKADKPGECPICGMDLTPVYEGTKKNEGIRIDPATIQNIGVKTEAVTIKKLERTIRTSGVVEFDETKLFTITTKFMGWVEKVYADSTGKVIATGDRLLNIYSPDLVSTQEEYLQALRYREKLQGSTLEEARQDADSLVQSTRRKLEYWDVPDREILALAKRGEPKRAMTIFSSARGIVMEKMVTDGQQVMAGMPLYKIADLSAVWITADIYQYELSWVRVGQTADFTLTNLPDKTFQGTVSYIYPYLNPETRTAKIRIEVKNTEEFLFKPEMFVTVKIVSPVTVDGVAVPEQAIIRSGTRNIAVIALGDGYFDPREVELGVSADGFVQITDGIQAGENIVTSAQFLIDSESNLKAAIGQMTTEKKPDQPEEKKAKADEMKTSGPDMSGMKM